MINRRVVLFSFAFLLALSFIGSFELVSAAEPLDTLSNVFSTIFPDSWVEGELDIGVARWAYFILLTLIIWSVLGFAPFLQEGVGQKLTPLIALGVSYLAMAYITPEEVFVALTSYTVLGIVLGGALPFVILGFFSLKISKEGGIGGRLLSKLLWFAFIIFLIARLITVLAGNVPAGMDQQSLNIYSWAYLIFLVATIAWMWFGESWFRKFLMKEEVQENVNTGSNEEIDKLTSEISDLQEMIANDRTERGLAGRNKQREDAIERKKSQIEALGGLIE